MKSINMAWACKKCQDIITTVGRAVVGKDEILEEILMGLLADGHLLIEDVPGVAKTLTAEMFAQVLDLEFNRIQFIPDLLQGDVTGGFIYNPLIEEVYVSPDIEEYIVNIAWETRRERRVQLGASPRGTLAMFKLARTRAMMKGRDFVTPEDVKAVAIPALAHRILLQPELWVERVSTEKIVKDVLNRVPTPKAGGS